MEVQIFGERCSGTNFVTEMIKLNCPQAKLSNPLGWKHGYGHSFESFEGISLCIFRDINSWLPSLHGQPWHVAHELRNLHFSDLIRREWECVWDEQAGVTPGVTRYMTEMIHERDPIINSRFPNVIKMRNSKYSHWLTYCDDYKNCIPISMEHVVKDPSILIKVLSPWVDFSSDNLKVPGGYKGKMSLKRNLLFKGSLGLLGGYKKKVPFLIPETDQEYILTQLDSNLENGLSNL